MNRLRHALLRHRRIALGLLAMALAMRAIVPLGFMVGTQAMVLTIQICADASGQHLSRQIVIPRETDPGERPPGTGNDVSHCPFASHGASALDGIPPAIVVIALAFLLILGFAPTGLVRQRRLPFLRPPLRAPPAQT